MVDRIKVAVKAKTDPNFVIMARTDAFANEGMEKTIERCRAYIEAGADMLFPEAFTKLEHYKELIQNIPNVPVLANITEFGKTPLFTREQLASVGVSIVLYPLSAHRAMAKAAEKVYKTILQDGTQEKCLDDMQTREELYNYLDYYSFEKKLDELNEQRKK